MGRTRGGGGERRRDSRKRRRRDDADTTDYKVAERGGRRQPIRRRRDSRDSRRRSRPPSRPRAPTNNDGDDADGEEALVPPDVDARVTETLVNERRGEFVKHCADKLVVLRASIAAHRAEIARREAALLETRRLMQEAQAEQARTRQESIDKHETHDDSAYNDLYDDNVFGDDGDDPVLD